MGGSHGEGRPLVVEADGEPARPGDHINAPGVVRPVEVEAVGIAAPADAGRRLRVDEDGALMGELERVVGVDRHHDVGIVGQFEVRKSGSVIPADGADDEGAGRVGAPNDVDRVGGELVPQFGSIVEDTDGFVQQFEDDSVGSILVALGDLFPDGQEMAAFAGRVGVELFEEVDVEHDAEVVPFGEVDEPIHLGEEAFVDSMVRSGPGVRIPADGDANVVKAAFGNEREEVVLNRCAPAATWGDLEVARQVDAAIELRTVHRRGGDGGAVDEFHRGCDRK